MDELKDHLSHLMRKNRVQRIVTETEANVQITPWRDRLFRLTLAGLDEADRISIAAAEGGVR